MTGLILLLVVVGLTLIWLAGRGQSRAGLPHGRLIYLDPADLGAAREPLYDAMLDLTGRPDYLVSTAGGVVPVEAKSGRAPLPPHDSHLLQLAAYCRLVQVREGQRPPYGVLKYADRAIAVPYTPALEARLLDALADMRRTEVRLPERSHDSAGRCRACGYRDVCDQRLA